MRVRAVLMLMLLLLGCATANKSVIQGQELSAQALETYRGNVERVVEDYRKKLMAQYELQLMNAFQNQVAELTDENGRVDAKQYDQLTMLYAQRLAEIDAFLLAEANAVNAKLNSQAAVVEHLDALARAYNEAAGVPPEKIEQLLEAGAGVVDAVATAQQQAEEAQQDTASQPKWGEAVRKLGIGLFQRYADQAARGLPGANGGAGQPASPVPAP